MHLMEHASVVLCMISSQHALHERPWQRQACSSPSRQLGHPHRPLWLYGDGGGAGGGAGGQLKTLLGISHMAAEQGKQWGLR